MNHITGASDDDDDDDAQPKTTDERTKQQQQQGGAAGAASAPAGSATKAFHARIVRGMRERFGPWLIEDFIAEHAPHLAERCGSDDELAQSEDELGLILHSLMVASGHIRRVLSAVTEGVGIRLASSSLSSFLAAPARFAFLSVDVEELGVRLKSLSFVNYAEARVLVEQSRNYMDAQQRDRQADEEEQRLLAAGTELDVQHHSRTQPAAVRVMDRSESDPPPPPLLQMKRSASSRQNEPVIAGLSASSARLLSMAAERYSRALTSDPLNMLAQREGFLARVENEGHVCESRARLGLTDKIYTDAIIVLCTAIQRTVTLAAPPSQPPSSDMTAVARPRTGSTAASSFVMPVAESYMVQRLLRGLLRIWMDRLHAYDSASGVIGVLKAKALAARKVDDNTFAAREGALRVELETMRALGGATTPFAVSLAMRAAALCGLLRSSAAPAAADTAAASQQLRGEVRELLRTFLSLSSYGGGWVRVVSVIRPVTADERAHLAVFRRAAFAQPPGIVILHKSMKLRDLQTQQGAAQSESQAIKKISRSVCNTFSTCASE
jgi:hypothetical protein